MTFAEKLAELIERWQHASIDGMNAYIEFRHLMAGNFTVLLRLVRAVDAIKDEPSMFHNETEDPQCSDPYIVDRKKFRELRAARAELDRVTSMRESDV